MKTFNAIQLILIIMAAPSGLQFLSHATFAGASALFWVGLIGTIGLSAFATVLVRLGLRN